MSTCLAQENFLVRDGGHLIDAGARSKGRFWQIGHPFKTLFFDIRHIDVNYAPYRLRACKGLPTLRFIEVSARHVSKEI